MQEVTKARGMVTEAGLYQTITALCHLFRKVLFSNHLGNYKILSCSGNSAYLWEFCDQSVTNLRLSYTDGPATNSASPRAVKARPGFFDRRLDLGLFRKEVAKISCVNPTSI